MLMTGVGRCECMAPLPFKAGSLLTGSEDGFLCHWLAPDTDSSSDSSLSSDTGKVCTHTHTHTRARARTKGGRCSALSSSGCFSTAKTKLHPPGWSVPVQRPHNPHCIRHAPLSALRSHGYLCPPCVGVHRAISTHSNCHPPTPTPPPSGPLQEQAAQVFPLLTRPLAPHPLLPLPVLIHSLAKD